MSGIFPIDIIGAATVRIETVNPGLSSRAHSGRRITREEGGHHWRLRATFGPLLPHEGRLLTAFAVSQRGDWDTFQFVSPSHAMPAGVATGTPQVDGGDQVGRTIATKGWTASVTGILKFGDLVKFAGHSKVYMVTAPADSDGDGEAVLEIEPYLHASPANNEAIQVVDVPFTVSFEGPVQAFDIRPPTLYEHVAVMVEDY